MTCPECAARRLCVENATARLNAKQRDVAGYPAFTRQRLTESPRAELKQAIANMMNHELVCEERQP